MIFGIDNNTKPQTTHRRGGGWGRVDLGNFFDSHAKDNKQ